MPQQQVKQQKCTSDSYLPKTIDTLTENPCAHHQLPKNLPRREFYKLLGRSDEPL